MEQLKQMNPLQAMPPALRWWPEDLGSPASSGAQNDMRFAFFPHDYMLLVDIAGTVTAYDSGNHQITGVARMNSKANFSFNSQNGMVRLKELKQVDLPV